MIRSLFVAALAALVFAPFGTAEEPKKEKPTVELSGDIRDEALQKSAPANGVIASQKEWDALAKAWGIKDAPKVDFGKELLIVGTWKGSSFNISPSIKDGDLTVRAGGTKDLRDGFRWQVKSIKRDGIKSVQGKPLPTA